MSKTFELETLKIRMGDADLRQLDLHQRVQRAMRALILDGALLPGLKLPATRSCDGGWLANRPEIKSCRLPSLRRTNVSCKVTAASGCNCSIGYKKV